MFSTNETDQKRWPQTLEAHHQENMNDSNVTAKATTQNKNLTATMYHKRFKSTMAIYDPLKEGG